MGETAGNQGEVLYTLYDDLHLQGLLLELNAVG